MSALTALNNLTVIEKLSSNPLSISKDGTVTRDRLFKVKLRDITDTTLPPDFVNSMVPVLLLRSSQIPKWHSQDPLVPGIWCTEINTTPDRDEPNVWEVTCKYEGIDVPGRGVASSQYNMFFGVGAYASSASTPFLESELPWHTPPRLVFEEPGVYEETTGLAYACLGFHKLRVNGSADSEDAMFTSDGDPNYGSSDAPFPFLSEAVAGGLYPYNPTVPIENAAYDSFTDPPQIQRLNKTYTWNWCMPAIDTSSDIPFEGGAWWAYWNDLDDSFNSVDMVITGISIPAFTGRIKAAKQKKLAFLGYPYYELALTVEVRTRSWIDAILNQGYNYLSNPANPQSKVPYVNAGTGDAPNTAMKLTASGTYHYPSDGSQSDPFWAVYALHPWRDWSFLGLPSEACPSYVAAGIEQS